MLLLFGGDWGRGASNCESSAFKQQPGKLEVLGKYAFLRPEFYSLQQGKQALMLQHPLTASYRMPLTAPTSYNRNIGVVMLLPLYL